jgi:hypothetical protein
MDPLFDQSAQIRIYGYVKIPMSGNPTRSRNKDAGIRIAIAIANRNVIGSWKAKNRFR